MRESYDASGRLTFDLPQNFSLTHYDEILRLNGCVRVNMLEGPGESWWDYKAGGNIVVLHWNDLAGISLHIEDGNADDLLRHLAQVCLEAAGKA